MFVRVQIDIMHGTVFHRNSASRRRNGGSPDEPFREKIDSTACGDYNSEVPQRCVSTVDRRKKERMVNEVMEKKRRSGGVRRIKGQCNEAN